jgi:thiol-disulfide isomerase/thioredoxin
MARNTLSQKGPCKRGNQNSTGSNRGIVLVLAGFTAAAIVVIALFAVLSTTGGGDTSNFTPNDQGLLPVGSEAPEFTADTVDGSVTVGGGSVDATMLVFFASWCPHCQNEAPIISDLENEYEDLQIVMVGVDNAQGDNPDKVRQFMERYDIQSPAVYEPSRGPEYQVPGYPTVYVLDGNGETVAANSGEAPKEVYEEWIQEALGS